MSKIQNVAVVGAGRMGKAIAIAFGYAGLQVKLIDAKVRAEQAFLLYEQHVKQDLAQELTLLQDIQFIQTDQMQMIQNNIEIMAKSTAIEFLKKCDLVMEAVPEQSQVKQDIFSWLDQYIPTQCIVASTTSTFLVTDIAKMLSHPERVVNAHWLNPAYLIPLVELSRSEQTSNETVEALRSFLTQIGKVPVLCNAKAGYIVPRIQALAMNEAARMVEEGVASAEDIDIAIRTGFGLRFSVLGLLEFIDWGGGDILYYASQYLQKELGERYATPEVIVENMQNNRNGLREKQGFYNYENMDVAAYKLQVLNTFAQRIEQANLKPKFNCV
ncbi:MULTISPECIES: 3-hydroxybutyryl-CoA dehydrogenase [unclassified Acinetobacter]|uniref:3-hydroxybutyryl-CoA dehydrogenase n=1 Tax=unclassified Acinetobacter TaxID=196816 RepID=UPI00257713D1|nr:MULTISPECIES: 3-hydroxybutyryl-CoA dehydrogenase [unclassified Acinetobacter]MDM1764684.1 3-hydroxybutyryl-CoA dehydrogenase [Acinetobacter sp. 226-1]MDM1768680.1 3-hydroxybutyryl-CoA dehydrogenase [Acinetobacter sp. 226-4]